MSTATEVLALGGHQKNTLAFSQKDRVVLMPHIGNLDSLEAVNDYARSLEQVIDMQQLSRSHKACDYHPDYHSTRVARSQDSVDILQVQHHEAHLLSCVAEHQIKGPVFGVAWDGTGYGADGTIWGGEFFTGSENGFSRWGHLKQFKLPGGAAAIRESRRAALGLLFAIGVQDANWNHSLLGLSQTEVSLLYKLMEQDLNSPYTSSAGRLFDGVSALIGIRNHCDYEGQAAIELEFKASQIEKCETYPIKITFQKSSEIDSKSQNILDWELWIQRILRDLEQGVTKTQIAAQFHKTLACSIVEMAKRAGIKQVVLSGGCFQNKLLSEWTILELRKNDFSPFWNQRVPPNDGGLSVGQVLGGHNVLIRSSSTALNLRGRAHESIGQGEFWRSS
jgi:hydrogenase maturation protein HypF